MITPVTQRQMFQTMNAEAVKTSSEVSGLLQRDAGQRQALLNRMAEDQVSVPTIPLSEGLRAEERQGGRQNEGHQGSGRKGEGAEAEDAPEAQANPAEGHMDFLA
jgi:hypothetical protein